VIRALTIVLSALALFLGGCGKPSATSSNEPLRFEVRGIVRGIGFADHQITIEHEEIPGFMPAMTMPFSVKEMGSVQTLTVGDAIRFQLVVTKNDSWITNVEAIAAKEIKLPPNAPPAIGNQAEAARLKEGDPLPDFHLVDDQNRPITLATFSGSSCILTFIFTRCPIPNFCPLMSKNFREIHEQLARDPKMSGTQLLSISFDPEYDTPAQLATYAANHRPPGSMTWRFATGSPEEIGKLTAAFAVSVKPESGTISHGLATALIDAHGVVRKIWRGNGWQPQEILEELAKLEQR